MTQQMAQHFGRLAVQHMAPGEQLLDMLTVVPVEGATGIGRGVGGAIGNEISQAGSVRGGPGTIASTFPKRLPGTSTRLLAVTDQRVVFLVTDAARKESRLSWQLPRGAVLGVQRTARLQMMARFRLHFADGSSVAVFTLRRKYIEALAGVLGAYRPARR